MQIVIKKGKVIATHSDEQAIEDRYEGAEVVHMDGVLGEKDPRLKLSDQDLIVILRKTRDQLLRESDWTQLMNSPLTAAVFSQWATYRQALRDFPKTCDPKAPIWPTKP